MLFVALESWDIQACNIQMLKLMQHTPGCHSKVKCVGVQINVGKTAFLNCGDDKWLKGTYMISKFVYENSIINQHPNHEIQY